jgi:hypothetical protein
VPVRPTPFQNLPGSDIRLGRVRAAAGMARDTIFRD